MSNEVIICGSLNKDSSMTEQVSVNSEQNLSKMVQGNHQSNRSSKLSIEGNSKPEI